MERETSFKKAFHDSWLLLTALSSSEFIGKCYLDCEIKAIMAEIIGVAASATQLGTACFSLIDVLRKIKGGASTLKRYHEQLQELQSLSTCISQNPLLQTPEIGIQTRALLSLIDNNCITSLLSKGRLLRTWGLLYKEQDLLDIFVRLERQKSTLSLAIEEIQSKTLYQIQTDIQNMAEKSAVGDSTAHSHNQTEPKISCQSESPQNPFVIDWTSSPDTQCIPRTTAQVPPNDIISYLALYISKMASSTNANEKPDARSPDNGGATWTGCTADPGFNQENGCSYTMNGKLSKELAKNPPNRCTFKDSIKIGKGSQRNGHHTKFIGDVTGATEPNTDGDRWINIRVKACASQEPQTEILGTQFNGNVTEYADAPTEDNQKE